MQSFTKILQNYGKVNILEVTIFRGSKITCVTYNFLRNCKKLFPITSS